MSYISDKIERDAKHKYYTPIGPLPSVTTITGIIDDGKSGALVGWAVRETCNYIEKQIPIISEETQGIIGIPVIRDIIEKARKEAGRQKDAAANIGKAAHDCVERWVKAHLAGEAFHLGYEPATHPEICKAWDAFQEFAAERGFRPTMAERMVYSRKHEFAGTLDIVALGKFPRQRRDKMYLIDCKTGTILPKTHGPQIAAYAEAWQEMSGEKVDGIAILSLHKVSGRPEWFDLTADWAKHWKVFKAARKLYGALEKNKGKERK